MIDGFSIRNFHGSDMPALYRICLETGDSGADASGLLDDELLGHVYAAPYAHFEPDLCFMVTRDNRPCGYVLGTADSAGFVARCEESWWPLLRQRYPLPSADDTSRGANIARTIHRGISVVELADTYPAHLHIDLLPLAQGKGLGRVLIEHFCDALRPRGVKGLHLGVGKSNQRAMQFYPAVGFELLTEDDAGAIFGMKL